VSPTLQAGDAALALRDFCRDKNRKLLAGFQRTTEVLLILLDGEAKSLMGALEF
jgi:hypothetical protein